MNKIVYLKAGRNVEVKKPEVKVNDLFEVVCSDRKILDKIKKTGYANLSDEEKKKLFDLSNKQITK